MQITFELRKIANNLITIVFLSSRRVETYTFFTSEGQVENLTLTLAGTGGGGDATPHEFFGNSAKTRLLI